LTAQEIVVPGAARRFTATLTLPSSPARAGVIPLHPASDGSRDQLLFRHLARTLPSLGVAVLRFDRRLKHRGQDVPLADQAADSLAAVDRLRECVGEPGLPVGLWGWSQGAWAAALAAAEPGRRVAFLILVACAGVSPAVQMRYGTSVQLRSSGYGRREQAELVRLRRAVEGALRGTISRADAQRVIDRYSDQAWFPLAWVPRRLTSRSRWEDMDYDPSKSFVRAVAPTLLFYGETDEWLPIDASVRAWRAAQRVSRNEDITIVRLPGTAHAPTLRAMRTRAISPAYTQTLIDWLKERGLARKRTR
jgi:uncharacterized protein